MTARRVDAVSANTTPSVRRGTTTPNPSACKVAHQERQQADGMPFLLPLIFSYRFIPP